MLYENIREKEEGRGWRWWICITPKVFLSLSISLWFIYFFIYFQQRSKRITPHLQLVSGIRQQFAAARGQRAAGGFARPSIIICCSLKRATALLPTFCTFSLPLFFFPVEGLTLTEHLSCCSLIMIYERYREDVVRSECGQWARAGPLMHWR